MATQEPSAQDIQALVAYLPKLYGDGAPLPIMQWIMENPDGTLCLPWPVYDETVDDFIDLIQEQGCWMDAGYSPKASYDLLMDKAAVRNATIPEIRQMLTVIVRSERFCAGSWAAAIEDGHVRRVLERLAEIGAGS